nr:MAG TPA: hypothetical protein [Caudoviricetes sp.]
MFFYANIIIFIFIEKYIKRIFNQKGVPSSCFVIGFIISSDIENSHNGK